MYNPDDIDDAAEIAAEFLLCRYAARKCRASLSANARRQHDRAERVVSVIQELAARQRDGDRLTFSEATIARAFNEALDEANHLAEAA